jgi:hypothetical protein
MNERIITIRKYSDIESLMTFILQKLKLVDRKNDYVNGFNDRLKECIDRDQSLKITIQVDRGKLERDLKFRCR